MAMAQSSIPSDLPTLVKDKFNLAQESGAVNFWPTEVEVLSVNGIPVCSKLPPKYTSKFTIVTLVSSPVLPSSRKQAEGRQASGWQSV